jgi:hypothetical protein
VVLVPLVYSVSILIIDLRVHPDYRNSSDWNVGIATARVFLYNFLTTVLLIVFTAR